MSYGEKVLRMGTVELVVMHELRVEGDGTGLTARIEVEP